MQLFSYPRSMSTTITHYCPGCTHGVIHRLVAEVIDELGLKERTVGIAPVGCSVLMYNYFDVDFQEAPHGRAPALATGAKRARPDLIVFTYQGDGDLASIGTNEIVHAANRGEKFTTVFVNNAIYGMTGGQMAPTTMPGQVTTTSPAGRDPTSAGYPMRMCELLSTLRTPGYVVRTAVHTHGIRLKKASLVPSGMTLCTGKKQRGDAAGPKKSCTRPIAAPLPWPMVERKPAVLEKRGIGCVSFSAVSPPMQRPENSIRRITIAPTTFSIPGFKTRKQSFPTLKKSSSLSNPMPSR